MSHKPASFLLALVLAGCGLNSMKPTLTLPVEATSTVSLSPLPSDLPTFTLQPIPATATPAKPAKTPTPTLVTQPDRANIPLCAGQGKVVSVSKASYEGTILYQTGSFDAIYAIRASSTVSQTILPEPAEHRKYGVIGYSPDGKWLAYFDYTLQVKEFKAFIDRLSIVMLSATGERRERVLNLDVFKEQLPGEVVSGFNNTHWINNELIYTEVFMIIPARDASGSDLIAQVLDPLSGEWRADLLSRLPGHSSSGLVSFSPGMARAFYEGEGGIVLRDMERGELWHDPHFPGEPFPARWAPDGSAIAYGHHMLISGLSLLSWDGREKRVIFDKNPQYGMDFAWSPDSRYLAVLGLEEAKDEWFIYDVAAGKYLFRCPVSGQFPLPWFLWSPDSSQVVFGSYEGPLQILDIKKQKIIDLKIHGVIPVGWGDWLPVAQP